MSQRRMNAGTTGSSSSGHAHQRLTLPIMDCPSCFVPVLRLVSKQPQSYAKAFYVCPNHDKEDPYSCGFYKWENAYEEYLCRHHPVELQQIRNNGQIDVAASSDGRFQLVPQGQLQLWREVEKLKHQILEVKQELGLTRRSVVIDNVVVLAACIGCFIGIVLALVLKQN
ncbi:hypothetical protein QOZ80_7BG0595390 [Eleusine coracana subsp. coracana]|nr:hypothetical protein QOZ80_7BG0595390 [Eleusine coracana subsp. coracana]